MSLADRGAAGLTAGRAAAKAPVDRRVALLVVPLLVFLGVFYAYPVLAMLWRSVSDPSMSLQNFTAIFSRGEILRVFAITLEIAIVATLICLALGYPLAYFMATTSPRLAAVALGLVLVPFWVSILVRSYAWMVLLGRYGLVNDALRAVGLTKEPVRLLNTSFALYLGMVHVLLPFMVLPIYGAIRKLDWRLVQAAEGLGARAFNIMRHVVVPLSLPGIQAGCVLVFVLALGFYVTPALLGGPRDMMISVLIATDVDLFQWGLASALAATLLAVTLVLVGAFDRLFSLEKVFGGDA